MTRITIDIPRALLLDGRNEIVVRVEGGTVNPHTVHPKTAEGLQAGDVTLQTLVRRLIDRFAREGRERLTETYASTLKCFQTVMDTRDLPLCQLTASVVEDFERRLTARGLMTNTTSFYLRILRAIYNRAVREGLTVDARPFVHVFTGKAKTPKRAISLAMVQRMATMQILQKSQDRARWLFLFSYYTRGMSFVDMAHLRKTDVSRGVLTYCRRKTGKQLSMAWKPEMQAVADKLPSFDGVHLLGILDGRRQSSLRRQCHSRQYCINKSLKQLGTVLGLSHPLTMYVARHSWATIARELNIPISIISDSMGHYSERTTQIYLQALDAKRLDQANDLMIAAVSKTTTNESQSPDEVCEHII